MKKVDQKVVFRVDASSQIGTGHFMRCLTLAEALKNQGAQIRFVSRHLLESLCDMLVGKGYEFVLFDRVQTDTTLDELAHANWLGTSQMHDAQATIHALTGEMCDWLIVDHYAVDIRWEYMLRPFAKRILVIDDLADRKHDCDMLLDQNFYTDMNIRYKGKVPSYCQLLLGPPYALLRDEFRQLHEQTKPRSKSIKRVLVFFGGIDTDNYTGRSIEALVNISTTELYVEVVIGMQHPFREQIETACIQHGFTCYVQTNRMAELMARADLAVGAGGSASWERCCLGLPALLVSLANNQIEIAKALDSFGACIYVGSAEKAIMSVLRDAILDLLNNGDQFVTLSERSYSLVDGLGVDRVCKILRC